MHHKTSIDTFEFVHGFSSKQRLHQTHMIGLCCNDMSDILMFHVVRAWKA